MNIIFKSRTSLFRGAALVLALGLSGPVWGQQQGELATPATESKPSETLYQCSMHPNIVSEEPGQCPICAMDLQPVEAIDAEGIPGRAPVRISEQQRQLINLVTAPARRESVVLRRSVPGVLTHDSSLIYEVAAWAGGRIEALHVDETEIDIEVGDPLYKIYSPEMFAAMEDFILVSRRAEADPQLLRAARFRLEQMGLTAGQIDALAGRDTPPSEIDILSRVAGKVMMKHLHEGQYVREGEKLYEVVDLSELWLIAEVYQSELPYVSRGQRVAMTLPGDDGRTFSGKIERIEHHIDTATRTARLRIVFDADAAESGEKHQHAHGLLPDMWMRAHLETDLGKQLTIPRSALFDTGQRQYVFVEQEPGLFVPRLVETGPRAEDRLVVKSGLTVGETVVESGTFLLDSESLLKASASGSEGEAITEDAMESESPAPAGFAPEAKAAIDHLWRDYFALSEALYNDEVATGRAALAELKEALDELRAEPYAPAVGRAQWRTWLNATEATLSDAPDSTDLQTLRIHFGQLSEALLALSADIPELRPDDLVVASCPMWTETNSEWMQHGETLRNPFMGQAMPTCGVIESQVGESKGGAR